MKELCPDQGAPVPPDFRALCAELVDELEDWIVYGHPNADVLLDRTRAALAQPVPPRPTDEEIGEWADACSEAPLEELDPEIHGWRRCFTAQEFGETIRAALARWGNTTPQPVPARRPKPPSLKKQALEILNLGHEGWGLANDDWQTLRRALEALPE